MEVIDPDGRRPLSLSEARTAQSFRLKRAGFYQIRFANGQDAVIGVNPDRRESDLEPIPDDLLQLWSGSNAAGMPTETHRAPMTSKYRPVNLWWYVMLLVLVVAVAETTLPAATWARSGRKHEQSSELNSYIARLQQRLRLGAWLRGAAIFAGTALVVTVVLVLVLNHLPFQHMVSQALVSHSSLRSAAAGAFGVALPLIRLTRRTRCAGPKPHILSSNSG